MAKDHPSQYHVVRTFLATNWTFADAKATAVSAIISACGDPRPPVTLLLIKLSSTISIKSGTWPSEPHILACIEGYISTSSIVNVINLSRIMATFWRLASSECLQNFTRFGNQGVIYSKHKCFNSMEDALNLQVQYGIYLKPHFMCSLKKIITHEYILPETRAWGVVRCVPVSRKHFWWTVYYWRVCKVPKFPIVVPEESKFRISGLSLNKFPVQGLTSILRSNVAVSAHSWLYAAVLRLGSEEPRLSNAIFSNVPGTSLGLIFWWTVTESWRKHKTPHVHDNPDQYIFSFTK